MSSEFEARTGYIAAVKLLATPMKASLRRSDTELQTNVFVCNSYHTVQPGLDFRVIPTTVGKSEVVRGKKPGTLDLSRRSILPARIKPWRTGHHIDR